MAKFWSDTNLEPKRQHRWALSIPGINNMRFYLTKTDKPSLQISETEHKFFGHSFWYPGHLTWQPLQMTLVDPFGNLGTSGRLKTVLERSGYMPPEEAALPLTLSKKNTVNATGGKMLLRQYAANEDGEAVEKEIWKLERAWFSRINFGTLDYNSDAMVTVDVTVRYDWATVVHK